MKKAFFPIFIMLIFSASSISFLFYNQTQDEVTQILSIEKELKVITEEHIEMVEEIKGLTKDVKETESAIINNKAAIKKMREELAEAKGNVDSLNNEIIDKENSSHLLNERLKNLIVEKDNISLELKDVQDNRVVVLDKIGKLEKERTDLQEKIKKAIVSLEGVELRKIIVKLHPPKEGRIIDINKEYSFAIINLGASGNVLKGDSLAVYREGEYIAEVIIENVYDDMSSIILSDEYRHIELMTGDTVVSLNKEEK